MTREFFRRFCCPAKTRSGTPYFKVAWDHGVWDVTVQGVTLKGLTAEEHEFFWANF